MSVFVPEPSMTRPVSEIDVIVLGSGAAGLAAAHSTPFELSSGHDDIAHLFSCCLIGVAQHRYC